jgi:DHA2 family multidrug resistance protein
MLCLIPAFTLAALDLTIVNVALAKLGAVFGVDVATVGWTITGFALATGVATPVASFAETRFTTKRVWVATLVLFTAGSLLCGLAPAFWVLVVARVAQGASVGILSPLAVSLLFRVFPEDERGGAFGFMAIPIVAGPALGPTLGGYLLTHLDWRWVFFVNLPVGVLAAALSALVLRPSEPRPDAPFDAVGALLSSAGFGSVLYGLSRVSQDGWGSLTVRGLVGVGLVSLVVFCAYETTRAEPLLEVRLFALPQFLIGNIVNWVGSIALLGTEFMMPLYLQNLRGLSALDAGLLLMPQGFAVALSAPMAGRLIDKVGARSVAIFGTLLLVFNTWELSQITIQTSFDTLRWLLVVRGIAFGFMLAPPKLTAMNAAPERLRTNASSLLNAMQSVFQSFGVALLATLVQSQTAVHRAVLGWQVRLDTPLGAFLGQVGALLEGYRGMPATGAHVLAMELIQGQILRQAAVLAFGDAYRITFIVALAAALLAALLPGRGAAKVDRSALAGGG